jgi:hypothetical protein
MRMANMTGDYDDRLFKWFVLSELDEKAPGVRLAIKVFSTKFKPDIVREIHRVLEIRYDLSERILYHPAKCCAGAMLGRVVDALGLSDSLDEMLEMGDEAFLNWVDEQLDGCEMRLNLARGTGNSEAAGTMREVHPVVLKAFGVRLGIDGDQGAEDSWTRADRDRVEDLRLEVNAARALSDRLRARHYYDLVFEVTAEADDGHSMSISGEYMLRTRRAELTREVEEHCFLPRGTVLVHCPRRKTNFKEAQVLVLYDPQKPPVPLNKADEFAPQLKRMAERARQLTTDYSSIWRLRVYVHPSYALCAPSVADFDARAWRVQQPLPRCCPPPQSGLCTWQAVPLETRR